MGQGIAEHMYQYRLQQFVLWSDVNATKLSVHAQLKQQTQQCMSGATTQMCPSTVLKKPTKVRLGLHSHRHLARQLQLGTSGVVPAIHQHDHKQAQNCATPVPSGTCLAQAALHKGSVLYACLIQGKVLLTACQTACRTAVPCRQVYVQVVVNAGAPASVRCVVCPQLLPCPHRQSDCAGGAWASAGRSR